MKVKPNLHIQEKKFNNSKKYPVKMEVSAPLTICNKFRIKANEKGKPHFEPQVRL